MVFGATVKTVIVAGGGGALVTLSTTELGALVPPAPVQVSV
jgi:hypothetical protein